MATKKEGDGNHPASHYLVVEDSSKPSTWHLRVRNASGKLDHTLMGAAWAALHGGYRGNKYQGPNKSAAIKKLQGLYRQEGMPTPGGKSLFYKDTAGQSWFLGIYSNNFEDREKETFTWNGHVEYAKWVNDTGVKLPVTVAHQPKYPLEVHLAQFIGLSSGKLTAKEFSDNYMKLYKPFAFAQTEAIIPLKGFVLVIAKILKGKEKVVQSLNEVNWGMSHGFLRLSPDKDTIDHYRSFEFTVLPPNMAANMLTVSSVKDKNMEDVTKALNDKDREILKNLLESDPTDLEEGLGEMQRILSTVFTSKELDVTEDVDATEEEEAVETETETEEVDTYGEFREKIFADLGAVEMHKAFTTMVETVKSLETRLADYEARLKEAERTEDEKVASAFYTPNWNMWDKATDEQPEDADELKDKALGEKPVDGIDHKNVTLDDNPLSWNIVNMLGAQQ